MTLEEIKSLVYPTETIDWIEVLKELVLMKFGEDKLITFNSIYLYSVGDPNEYACGIAVINDRLFVLTNDGDGCDSEFGTAYFGSSIRNDEGIGLTESAIKSICKAIFEERLGQGYKDPVGFDFSNMEGRRIWFDDFFLKAIKRHQEEFDSFVKGESCGYFNV